MAGDAAPTFRSVAAQLVREEGLRGFARGLLPRIANTALCAPLLVSFLPALRTHSVGVSCIAGLLFGNTGFPIARPSLVAVPPTKSAALSVCGPPLSSWLQAWR